MGKHSLYSSSTIKMAMTQEQPLKSIAEQAETCSFGHATLPEHLEALSPRISLASLSQFLLKCHYKAMATKSLAIND